MLMPILVLIALLVYLSMGSPIIFRQTRPGLDSKPFTILKFRTMRPSLSLQDESLSDAERLTTVGSFLRRSSLDELPELWCVFKGDMSLVGPRPLLTRYLPYFRSDEWVRFLMRPGITGWAQVNGRNHSTWDQRLADDVWYVQNWSLWLDLRILLRTFRSVVARQNVVDDARSLMLNLDEERRQSDGQANSESTA